MKLLVVLGSPRKGGNSETIAEKIAEPMGKAGWSIEYMRLNDLKLRPCQGCGGCDKTGMCVIKDDMQELLDLYMRSDIIVFAGPVYVGSVT